MSDSFDDKFLSAEEKGKELERCIEQMKDEIKQLKKINKHKEKIEKLEHEKRKIISRNLKSHRKRH